MRIPYRNKLLFKKTLRFLGITSAVLVILFVVLLIYADSKIVYDRNGAHITNDMPNTDLSNQKPTESLNLQPPEIIYEVQEEEALMLAEMGGHYITTSMLQKPDKVLQQLKTISEPCAVIIELKSIFGNFYYSTDIDAAKTASVDTKVVDEIIKYLRDNNFYMIASVCAFSDTNFALANQACGLPLKNGALWMDENGCYWLDPAQDAVISYLTQIVRELATLGFHEVSFSDFRFPSSSNIHYESSKTGVQIVQSAAKQLTDFFKGSNIIVSFSVKDTDFPVAACNGRLYISDVDGSKIERFMQTYGNSSSLTELVFLVSSRDTRFDEFAVLRPLMSQ